ncbi:MAG TPA: HAMP domain-containing sensor histidine kinase [Gallionellaceae bacterium]|nr:HAMP domain-containing sensor histidine kinase [Gallionellaceae bacterium]
MKNVRHSFRFRLAFTFALFGAMVSLLLATGLSLTAHNLGERLIDETLRAEIEDYISRRTRNPDSLPPSTVSIRGYVFLPGQANAEIPAELHALMPGKYQLTLNNIPYRIAVADQGNKRYVMMFNEIRQRQRETTFLLYLVAGTLIMTLVSAWLGWWLAGRVVAPITELARRVGKARPENSSLAIAKGLANDEIGRLAIVFEGYLKRMRAFIDRERAFTADVSHELRTPLAIVLGVVELMEEDTRLLDKQKERVERIGRATRGMIDVTSALLLMAREASADEPVIQKCDVCDIVAHVIDMHRHLLNEHTTTKLVCLAHPHIEAERTLFGIVVANLIRNAFTYTPSGSVTITVEDNCLTVTDTGTGIHSEEIGKVFQRHFKGSGSTGSGIGLSLVKRICDRYGWETVIESTEGTGTSAQLFFARSTTENTTS